MWPSVFSFFFFRQIGGRNLTYKPFWLRQSITIGLYAANRGNQIQRERFRDKPNEQGQGWRPSPEVGATIHRVCAEVGFSRPLHEPEWIPRLPFVHSSSKFLSGLQTTASEGRNWTQRDRGAAAEAMDWIPTHWIRLLLLVALLLVVVVLCLLASWSISLRPGIGFPHTSLQCERRLDLDGRVNGIYFVVIVWTRVEFWL